MGTKKLINDNERLWISDHQYFFVDYGGAIGLMDTDTNLFEYVSQDIDLIIEFFTKRKLLNAPQLHKLSR